MKNHFSILMPNSGPYIQTTMRKFVLFTFIVFGGLAQASAQDGSKEVLDDAEAVKQVVVDLFDAMRAGDGEAVAALFTEGAILESMGESEDGPVKRVTPIDNFAQAITGPHERMLDERIWDITVHVNQRLATVWTKYAFYLGEEFSHCGVDSIVLFKSAEGWKMTYLADTREREGCEIPESIQNGQLVGD